MAVDVFSVLVKIGVVSDHKAVLGSLISTLGIAESTTQKLIKSLGGVKAALGVIGAAVAAKEIYTLTGKLIGAGAAVSDLQAKLYALGDTKISVALDTSAAQAAAQKVGGVTTSSALQQFIELRSVTSTEAEARAVLPGYAEAARNLAIFNAGHGSSLDAATILPLLKAAELQGAFNDPKTHQIDPARILGAIKAAEAALELTNGVLTPSAFMRATNLAGPAAQTMDFTKWIKEMAEAVMAMGPTAGRGAMMGFKSLVGGSVTKAQAEALEHMGLINPRDVLKDHGHYSLRQGKLAGYDTLTHEGMDTWLHQTVIPLLQKANHGKPVDDATIMRAWASFPITFQRLLAFDTNNEAQITKFGAQYDTRMGTDANAQLMNTSVTANVTALNAAFADMLQTFGLPLVQPAISVLHGLTSVGHDLSALGQIPGFAGAADAVLIGTGVASSVKLIMGTTTALRGLFTVLGGAGVATAGAELTGLATGVEAVAGVTGLAAAGVSLTGVAAGIGAIAGAAAVFGKAYDWLMKGKDGDFAHRFRPPGADPSDPANPGSHYAPPDAHHRFGHMVPNDAPADPNNSKPSTPIHVSTVINMDGRYLATVVSKHQARFGELPQAGFSGVDTAMISPSAGQQVRS